MDKLKASLLFIAIILGVIALLGIFFVGFIKVNYDGDYSQWWEEWKFGATLIFSITALGLICIITSRK